MPAPYLYPNNITGMGALAVYIHSVDAHFFNLLLVSIWVLIFLGTKVGNNSSAASSFTAASFVVAILTMFLQVLGVVTNYAFFLALVMAIGGGVWLLNEGR